jgi:uncharacterized protein (TIGR02466 family)
MIHNIFATPYYCAPVEQKETIDSILDGVDVDNYVEKHRFWDCDVRTGHDMDAVSPSKDEWLDVFLGIVQPHIFNYIESTIVDDKFDYRIHWPWFNLYEKGEHQEVHIHNRGSFSWCYFHRLPEDSSKFSFINKDDVLNSYGNNGGLIEFFKFKHYPNVKEGDIVVFPSWLMHMVSPHKNDKEERITISGNVSLYAHPE